MEHPARKYDEENVRYESAVVLPGSRVRRYDGDGSVVDYRGVDVWVFPDEQSAQDWMDDALKSYLWSNKGRLLQVCKAIAGPSFSYARYVDWESLAKFLISHYHDSSVVPKTFRNRFKDDAEGKRCIYDHVTDVVRQVTNADYRLSLLLFDFMDVDSLVEDLEAHLGMRAHRQGSFYYVVDLYPKVLK